MTTSTISSGGMAVGSSLAGTDTLYGGAKDVGTVVNQGGTEELISGGAALGTTNSGAAGPLRRVR